MKLINLAKFASLTAGCTLAFNGIPFGNGKDNGTISYIERDDLLVWTLYIDPNSCAGMSTREHNIGYFTDPSALSDWEKNERQPFEYCRLDQMGEMVDNDAIPSGAFSDKGDGRCVAIFNAKIKLEEFMTVKYLDSVGVRPTACATLTHGKLSYAKKDVEGGTLHAFRSQDQRSFAIKMSPNQEIAMHWDMDHDGLISARFYSDGKCQSSPHFDQQWNQKDLFHTVPDFSDYPANWRALWMNAGQETRSVEFVYRFVLYEGTAAEYVYERKTGCVNIRKMNYKKSAKKLILDPNRKPKTKYVALSIEQDNPFVPSKYTIKYNHKGHKKADPNNLPGGYHIHETPADPTQPDNCAITGGHWNPYNKNKIDDPDWAYAKSDQGTHYDFEIGDLSSRYGSLGLMGVGNYDRVGFVDQFNDWNLPLFGANSCENKSIVFHRLDDNSRLMCFDLVEDKAFDRKANFGFF